MSTSHKWWDWDVFISLLFSNPESITWSENESEREKQISYINTYIQNPLKERWCWWAYMQGSKGNTVTANRSVDTVAEGEETTYWESSTETKALPHMWPVGIWRMMQEAQLWCPVTTYRWGMGWEVGMRFKRDRTYVFLWLIHVDARQKPTIL